MSTQQLAQKSYEYWKSAAEEDLIAVKNFVNGVFVESAANSVVEKISPRNGQRIYEYLAGSPRDVDLAVSSACASYNSGVWRDLSVYERKEKLLSLSALIERRADEFALYECLDTGKPIVQAESFDVPSASVILQDVASEADKLLGGSAREPGHFGYQLRKPIGVVAAIVGWNYPLLLALTKVAPALAVGNSVVLKPSELSPMSACLLAELAIEAGIPPGILNLVNGTGETVGDALSRHHDVDLVTFTGSTLTGRRLMAAAGESNMKRLILECGGKSPYLVFEDCVDQLDNLAASITNQAFYNQGAVCSAPTRLLIHESVYEPLVERIVEETRNITAADPLDPDTSFGALISEGHLNKVLGYIESGKADGARKIFGGERAKMDSGGFYIEPAIFECGDASIPLAQEEIFGPVLTVFKFRTESEAVQLANNTKYGLAAYLATNDARRIQRLSACIDAGLITVTANPNSVGGGLPIGIEPQKQSGFGFEGGLEGLAAYTQSSQVRVLF